MTPTMTRYRLKNTDRGTYWDRKMRAWRSEARSTEYANLHKAHAEMIPLLSAFPQISVEQIQVEKKQKENKREGFELRKIQTGDGFATRIWEYRGIRMEGNPPRHGWGSARGAGGGWSWYADIGRTHLGATTRKHLMEKIDAQLNLLRELGEL